MVLFNFECLWMFGGWIVTPWFSSTSSCLPSVTYPSSHNFPTFTSSIISLLPPLFLHLLNFPPNPQLLSHYLLYYFPTSPKPNLHFCFVCIFFVYLYFLYFCILSFCWTVHMNFYEKSGVCSLKNGWVMCTLYFCIFCTFIICSDCPYKLPWEIWTL